jgi:ABC-type multidrug transport system ATPase subunit
MRIELKEVHKSFGNSRALKGVSLTFEPGQIMAVLGINGAGKTTLLRALAGVVSPDHGDILFDAEPFRLNRLDQRKRLWFLPDFPPLFDEESLLNNLSLILRCFEADGPGVEEKVASLLGELDLLGKAHLPVGALSRGQRYKAALTALVCADPELWLLDEPYASGMDPVGQIVLQREVRAAAARQRTVLFTTQFLDVVGKLADRVIILKDGEVQTDVKTADLLGPNREGSLESLFRPFTAGS